MYGKIFAQMYDGSLYGKWQALVTFQQLIVLADAEGVVDMTSQAIAGKTSIPLEIIQQGLVDLEFPDPSSRTPDYDGRRILRLSEHREWGWRITNYKHYCELRSQEERREYLRRYQRSRRKPVNTASTGVNNGKQLSTMSTDIDIDVDVDVRKTIYPYSEEFEAAWQVYPKRPNNSKRGAWRAWNARLANGETPTALHAGIQAYAAYVLRDRTDPKYIKHAATFLGPDQHYRNDFGQASQSDPEQCLPGEIRWMDEDRGAGTEAVNGRR